MYDVHVRIVHKIPPVRVGLKLGSELLDTLLQGVVKVVLVHIADRDQTATFITREMKAAHSDTARTDNASCQLVAWSDELLVTAHSAEHITWQDREQRQSRRRLFQKTSSGFTHSAIVIKYFYVLTDFTNLHFLPLRFSILARQKYKKRVMGIFSHHSILYSVYEYSYSA